MSYAQVHEFPQSHCGDIFMKKSLKKYELLKVTTPRPGMSKQTCNQHFSRKFGTIFISHYFQHITKSFDEGFLYIYIVVNFPTRYHALAPIF